MSENIRRAIVTLLVAILVLGTAMTARSPAISAPTGSFADIPVEPTYESACKNWKPLVGQCVVMAPKNGRSKFISGMNGDVHTAYVSQALGDCPLIPSLKPLEQRLSEGIQVIIGTGARPDFRLIPRNDVHQRLYKGSLPMVTTAWQDANKLSYEQLGFVRLMGDELDVTKGDENAAAFIRLRVRNESATSQKADMWLSVCGSPNGQGREVILHEYRGQLHLGKARLTNEKGELRLMWKAPAGAVVDSTIRDKTPALVPQEWGVRTSVRGHGPERAFDKIHTTWWTPTLRKLTEPAAIGMMFGEKRWIRAVHIWSHTAVMPTLDGHQLQYFDGKSWIPISASINDKTMDELKSNPDIYDKFLETRSYRFDPI